MNRTVLATAVLLSIATGIPAQEKIFVDIEIKETAKEQLRYAQSLAMEYGRARDDAARHLAVARAGSAFDAVRKKWPRDAGAYIQSLLLQSDLFHNANAPENVIRLLAPHKEWIAGNGNEPALLRRLGTAYGMTGNEKDAEKAFQQALKSKILDTHPDQAMLLHRAAALFHSRGGRSREAAVHFRHIMRNRGLRDGLRADAALNVLDVSLQGNDKAAARADLAEVSETVKQAMKSSSPDMAAWMERQLASLAANAQ
ncbi:MAG TPA: hypothetical protein VF883_00635 [Thermoanaerobaculia bacterium]|jgi:tetratricopeptide (TPR) repeat protein